MSRRFSQPIDLINCKVCIRNPSKNEALIFSGLIYLVFVFKSMSSIGWKITLDYIGPKVNLSLKKKKETFGQSNKKKFILSSLIFEIACGSFFFTFLNTVIYISCIRSIF